MTKSVLVLLLAWAIGLAAESVPAADKLPDTSRMNVLFIIAEDWSANYARLLRQSDLQDAEPGPVRLDRRPVRCGLRAGHLLQSFADFVPHGPASADHRRLVQRPGDGPAPAARHRHAAGDAEAEGVLDGGDRQVLPHRRVRRKATAGVRPHRDVRQAAGLERPRADPDVPARQTTARRTRSGPQEQGQQGIPPVASPAIRTATATRAARPRKKATIAMPKPRSPC